MRKKAIWLFGGGELQIPLAKSIKNLDYFLILSDKDPNCPLKVLADHFTALSTYDAEANIKYYKEYLQKEWEIKLCITVAADCHLAVSEISHFLKTPSHDVNISRICADKFLTRELLLKSGLKQPKVRECCSIDEVRLAAKDIGYPVVLKAPDNSGSRGFQKIESKEEMNLESYTNTAKYSRSGKIIVEEFLVPSEEEISEYSCEAIWVKGEFIFLNCVSRIFGNDIVKLGIKELEDNFKHIKEGLEIGHINPCTLSEKDLVVIKNIMKKVGKALKYNIQEHPSVLKLDLFKTTNEFVCLEATPRLSGGYDSSLSTPLRGADFQLALVLISLGDLEKGLRLLKHTSKSKIVTVLSNIDENFENCIGRKFSVGEAEDLQNATINAINNLKQENYVQLV